MSPGCYSEEPIHPSMRYIAPPHEVEAIRRYTSSVMPGEKITIARGQRRADIPLEFHELGLSDRFFGF